MGGKKGGGVALQGKGLRHQKSHVHCPCPRCGAKLPGSTSPGGGSRNAGLQPRPATTHRPTQGARNNQNENLTEKHTPKSRALPPPQPQTRAACPCNPPPKNKPKLFLLQLFFSFLLFFFPKVLGFLVCRLRISWAAFSSPFAFLLGTSHGYCLHPHTHPQDGTAELVQSSPRGWTEDMRPGKIQFFREEN